jgi:hypothetical protein
MSSDYIGTVIPAKWKPDYLSGQMDSVMDFMKTRQVSRETFIKSGSTCVVWQDPQDEHQVIKLCTKRIEFFKSFPGTTVDQFKKIVGTEFRSMLLPIKEILYDDRNYFVYTQEKIKVLDFSEINVDVMIKILEVIKTMFQQKMLTSDLISSNFGWDSNHQLSLLDYHDMKSTTDFFKKAKWSKIVRCLVEYVSRFLYHNGFEEYTGESIMQWKSELTIIKQEFGAKYFPKYFINLFKSFSSANYQNIINHLSECQQAIKDETPTDSEGQHVIMEKTNHKDHKEHTSHKDHKDHKVHKEHTSHKERKEHTGHREHTSHKEHTIHKEHTSHKEHKEHTSHKERTKHRDHKERTSHKEHKERTKHRDHKEHMEHDDYMIRTDHTGHKGHHDAYEDSMICGDHKHHKDK